MTNTADERAARIEALANTIMRQLGVVWVFHGVFGSPKRVETSMGGELRAFARAPLRPKVRLISGHRRRDSWV